MLAALCWGGLAGSVVAVDKEVPPAWVNAVDTNAMERVLLDRTNNVAVLTYSNAMVYHSEIMECL